MTASSSSSQVTDILSRIPYFKHLTLGQLQILAPAFSLIKCQDGEVLVLEGQAYDKFMIVLDGELERLSRGIKSGTLRHDDYFGFLNLFNSHPSSNTVVAKYQTTLYTLNRTSLERILEKNPQIAFPLLSCLAESVPEDKISFDSQEHAPIESPLSKIHVRIFDTKPYQREFFIAQNEQLGFKYELEFLTEKLTLDTVHLAAGAQVVCVFVHDTVNEEIATKLKEEGVMLVAYRSAGFESCDVANCDNLGLSVVRVPSYSPNAIAEHAIALLLALNRKLVLAHNRVHTGDFSLDGLVGFDMKGKTAGVIGTGRIGFNLVQILLGFGCRIICYDVYKNPELLKNPAISYVELDQLLAESDLISLHAPLTPATHHIINEKTLAKMKKGVMIVNTSRGGLVDTKALIEALKSGHIGGCGVDVVEGENDYFYEDVSEKPITNDLIARLLSFNNVILTAHQAYLTREALNEIAVTTLKNIREFQLGKRMKMLTNSVNNVMPKSS